MHKGFLEFLTKRGVLPVGRIKSDRAAAGPSEPIGAIAFRHGLLNGAAIDEILDKQRGGEGPFGEVAIALKLLTQEQVGNLLRVQEMRKVVECAEVLILSGVCPAETVASETAVFLAQSQAAFARVGSAARA